ncbi:transcriptional regulator, NifA, Fis Family [Methylocella silvestris BL2]|uniref:Nif-specific regulatory protein n=1 Tax=Methylocella silvestris (strain DSM 15510 / CIP 108128 / LMG 27833 / NCIMB 13906 / BL2) TaxID=395965 RepID=B8EJ41_METSB|nr:nif-specific transcriptional activator NifA [Methylocella silvestris]ACK52533.1 transcriptional regulator, NifA, Fis Family [Methylocella silvestris BL2]
MIHAQTPTAPQPIGRAADPGETTLVGIYEISKLLASVNRLEVSLAGVLTLLSSFLEMRHGLIALLDKNGKPEIVVGSGWSEQNAKLYFDRLPERAIGQIVTTKMPLVVENVYASPLFEGSDLTGWGRADGEPFALIGVPIKDGDEVIGALTVDRNNTNRTSVRFDHDVRFLTMIANLVGQTLRLQKLVARDRERLMQENARLEKSARPRSPETRFSGIEGIVGDSPAVRAVVKKIRIVAKSRSTVLLRGESGTGKELFAAAIHNLSPRSGKPFIKLNCAALPESVLESELFGHERGAFTGALATRKGRFELADGGTLFLDEIGDISPAFQVKLLRVLQEGEFERVGGARPLKVDVRLVCATNKNLEDAVKRGEFRADLYYRITVVPIFLPPLREREGDILPLANEFLHRFNSEQKTDLVLTASAIAVLKECKFPGNIRELENCVRRTATMAPGDEIEQNDFACHNDGCLSAILWKGSDAPQVSHRHVEAPVGPARLPPVETARDIRPPDDAAAPPHLADGALPPAGEGAFRSDRERIVDAMERAGWVKAKAARVLGITPRQIGYALRKHNIRVKKF